MPGASKPEILLTGAGVVTAIGQGRQALADALFQGRHAFGVMQRPGRQWPAAAPGDTARAVDAGAFLGAELPELRMPVSLGAHERSASLSAKAAVACLHEAWQDARLADVDPERVALVVGGSNFQQREQALVHEAYRDKREFLRPSYALAFMDSDLCGLCTELFGIRGGAFTVGGASASGQLAVLQACEMVELGRVDACIAIGALMDLSFWECQAFRAMGAMGSDRFASEPAAACRPFDGARDGFIYGECCAAVVVEKGPAPRRQGVAPYARILGRAMHMDGNRNPDPALAGELAVIRGALQDAGVGASEIDYINPHGSGSRKGDETELQALAQAGLSHAFINTTKSLVGHGLTAAGTVELVATLLQMRHRTVHPARNLVAPIDDRFNWVRSRRVEHDIRRALKMSIGFGGINTAICLERA